MKKKRIFNSIIENWIDMLLKDRDARNIDDLSADILEREISEAEGTIANCTIWDDWEGVALNEQYKEMLETELDRKKPIVPQDYITNQIREKMNAYAVDITELFQKTVIVKAANGSDAVEIVRRKYFADEITLTVDDDFIETQFRLIGEVKC